MGKSCHRRTPVPQVGDGHQPDEVSKKMLFIRRGCMRIKEQVRISLRKEGHLQQDSQLFTGEKHFTGKKFSLSWSNCKGSNTEDLQRIWTQIKNRMSRACLQQWSLGPEEGRWPVLAGCDSQAWSQGLHAWSEPPCSPAHGCQLAGAEKAIASTQPHPWDGIHTQWQEPWWRWVEKVSGSVIKDGWENIWE